MGFVSLQSKFKGPVKIDGSFKGKPPIGFGLILIGLGALTAAMSAGVHPNPTDASYSVWLVRLFIVLVGMLFMGAGVGFLRVRHALKRCMPADALGALYSAEPDAVSELAKERGIQPRFIINGQSWYNPDDLGDAMTLLRPASSEGSNSLLRPAGASASPPDQLLRTSSPTAEQSEIPAQPTYHSNCQVNAEQNVHVGTGDSHE
jgi:hypothetical protein